MYSPLFEFFDPSSPYESLSSPSAMLSHIPNGRRFDPYVRPIRGTAAVPTVSQRVSGYQPNRPSARPTAAAAAATGEIIYKNIDKGRVRPLEQYCAFDPSRILHEDPTLLTHRNAGGKKQFWFFILGLLMDPSYKDAISWTGRGREFVITCLSTVNSLWSTAQGMTNTLKPETILRNIRAGFKRRVFLPVYPHRFPENRFAFHTEPSIHLGMTRDELSNFIANNNSGTSFLKDESESDECKSLYPTPPSSTTGKDDGFGYSTVSSAGTVFPTFPTVSPTPPTVSLTIPTVPPALHAIPSIDVDRFFDSPSIAPHTVEPVHVDSYWSPPLQSVMPSFTHPIHYQLHSEHNDYFGDYRLL